MEAGECGFHRSGYEFNVSIPVAYLLPMSLAVLKPGKLVLRLLRIVCIGTTDLTGMQNSALLSRLCHFNPLHKGL